VEEIETHATQAALGARAAHGAHDLRAAEPGGHECGDELGRVLEVGVEGDDRIGAGGGGAVETGGEAGGTVTVSATTQDIGDAASVVDGVVEGEGLQIGFNSKYIADALNVMKSQQVALELVGPQQAGVLRPVSDVDFLHIIMPVSVPR